MTVVGFLDVLLGRSRPIPPTLDALFGLPSAAVTLQVATGLRPTGVGSVAFKSAEGATFAALREQAGELLALDGGRFQAETDGYGFTWLVRSTSPDDLSGLVADLHTVNSTLADAGFGSALLCTVVGFTDGTHPVGLVYLYKRGSWYPFAPQGSEQRDTSLEMQVRSALEGELQLETDLSRWFPVYGAPGL
ncbi:MAG TPA: hypothetical protein VHO29_19745 [Marmoricola sp.]|nr:hypothetical protein [Marmoricola sp.]